MRVSWTNTGVGYSPLLTVGLRRHGKVALINPMLLVDTGADGTVLPIYSAGLLGFSGSDLLPELCTVAGGQMTVHRPVDLNGTEIEINGVWLALPSLRFADQILFPLLGRDIIFRNFELRMTGAYFDLIPLSKNS